MSERALISLLRQRCDNALLWLIPVFLFIDFLNGALLQQYGNSFALSAGYKLILLILMALVLLTIQPRLIAALAGLLALLLFGPSLHWPDLAGRWWLIDVQLVVKVVSPLLAFSYFFSLAQRAPAQGQLLFKRTLYLSVSVLLLNTLLGLAGFGLTAYQPLDGVPQSFLGIKGFFYSANELSALLLVISSAVLVLSWPKHKVLYLLLSAAALTIALLMLTKTGLLGVLVLVLFTPLLLQRRAFWRQQKQWLMLLLILSGLLLLILLLNGESVLRLLGVYDKLNFVYQRRGISGIVLSSRDYYAGQIWQTAASHYDAWQRLLGVGQGAIALYLKKYFAEMDWFDLLVFYGVAGLGVFILTFAVFFYYSWSARSRGAGRCLLLLNLLLLLVSMLAGHVLTSGMLWLPWALSNALLVQFAGRANTSEPKYERYN